MPNQYSSLTPLLRGLIASCLLAAPMAGYADDIELFVSTDNQPFQCENPNVMFLIDTSGSMDTRVETQVPFDPGTTYEGCHASDAFYYDTTGTPPACDGADAGNALFEKSANACAAVSGTEYTGELQAWDPDNERWVRLDDADPAWLVECHADEGIHGDGSSPERYAADGADGPWTSDPNLRIAWGSNASAVTVFDGNWLNWLANPATEQRSRIDIVRDVTKATLDNIQDVSVSLMTFNPEEGGSVNFALEPIDSARAPLKAVIDGLDTGAQTPLSEALYEYGQYLRGASVTYGDPPDGESVAASRTGNTLSSPVYRSPLASNGQNTYIVLLTDGEPSHDGSANSLIESLPDYGTLVGETCNDSVEGSCLPAIAEYLQKADLRPDIEGQQNAVTHTIGFGVDLDLLEETARRGGGRYFVADNTASLTTALTNLSKDFARSASLLTAPQIPVDQFNQTERLDQVYVSVFEPSANQHWQGNVKRYRLARSGDRTRLVDARGRDVIDPMTGTFNTSAVSIWSAPTVDGDKAQAGGAAGNLPAPAARRILSNVSSGNTLTPLSTSDASLTAALVGAPSNAERDLTIDWALGFDSRDADEDSDTMEPRRSLGDPLHVNPVTVSYGSSAAEENALVFVATNDGYLHAIDVRDGVEQWSFIPRRLLGRLYELSLEQPAINKSYGLDGEIRVVRIGDRKILVFGMRRGGHALFALDVTDRNDPGLLWVIDRNTSGFEDLGQTWSPAVPGRIAIGASEHDVIFFAGGYDGGQDGGSFRADTQGNAVYIVDTLSGNLLWSAGSATAVTTHNLELDRMHYSIPSELAVLDSNDDTLADRLYFGDMGGQVWRIDIVNGQNTANLGEGGVLASLAGASNGSAARGDARRFYTPPGIVNALSNGRRFTAINIGSGYRAHPLETATSDEFYSIRDFHGSEVVPTERYDSAMLPVVERADLRDITDDLNPLLEDDDAGWRLSLEAPGEKVLSASVTISNVLFFNSFTPNDQNNSCRPAGGRNRLYQVSLLDGSPLTNLDRSLDNTTFAKTDRFIEVGRAQDVPLELTIGPQGPCLGLDCPGSNGEPGDGENGTELQLPDINKPIETYWYPVTRP